MLRHFVRPAVMLAVSSLFATSAFATRARVISLQGADHIMDEQTVFKYPARIHGINPLLTFEMGGAGSDAEGGIVKKMDDKKLFVYLGRDITHLDVTGTDIRSGYLPQNNPIDITYGAGDWAVGATLSMVDNKAAKTKEQTASVRFGKNFTGGEFFVSGDLVSTATKANDDKLTAAPYLGAGFGKDLGNDYRIFGQLTYGTGKEDIAASGASNKITDIGASVGFEDRSLKAAGSDLYYGAQLNYGDKTYDTLHTTGYSLPVFIGLEYDVNTWAVVRGSVAQNLLIGQIKKETATVTDPNGIAPNTRVAAGLGLKYNRLQLDGTLEASTSGQINGTAFLAKAGLLYYY